MAGLSAGDVLAALTNTMSPVREVRDVAEQTLQAVGRVC